MSSKSEFDSIFGVRMEKAAKDSSHAGYQALHKVATKAASKPPKGFVPIPNSKHGGYHKQVGGHWETWYPGSQMKRRYDDPKAAQAGAPHRPQSTALSAIENGGHTRTTITITHEPKGEKWHTSEASHDPTRGGMPTSWASEIPHESLGEALDYAHKRLHGHMGDTHHGGYPTDQAYHASHVDVGWAKRQDVGESMRLGPLTVKRVDDDLFQVSNDIGFVTNVNRDGVDKAVNAVQVHRNVSIGVEKDRKAKLAARSSRNKN